MRVVALAWLRAITFVIMNMAAMNDRRERNAGDLQLDDPLRVRMMPATPKQCMGDQRGGGQAGCKKAHAKIAWKAEVVRGRTYRSFPL